MAEQPPGEKTLPASQQKLLRAREEGNVAKSQDLSAGVMLMLALLGLYLMGRSAFDGLVEAGQYFFYSAGEIFVEPESVRSLLIESLYLTARVTLPIMVLLLFGGVAINILQVGFLMSGKVITPKLDRINPVSGFQRYFTPRPFVELVKSILKFTIAAFAVYWTLRGRTPDILSLMHLGPLAASIETAQLVASVWWRVALIMLILGILDFAYQRWQYLRDLRMTQQEARQEMKQFEGDPQIKQRIRQIQRQMAMQRMMREVPTADVVITNPTTYAVALRYDEAVMAAPVVVAKGARLVAERIRDIATEHHVPIVEKRELAQTLYRTVEVGQPVPEGVFRAVAEVLAYVYQIDRRAEKVRERERYRMARWAS